MSKVVEMKLEEEYTLVVHRFVWVLRRLELNEDIELGGKELGNKELSNNKAYYLWLYRVRDE